MKLQPGDSEWHGIPAAPTAVCCDAHEVLQPVEELFSPLRFAPSFLKTTTVAVACRCCRRWALGIAFPFSDVTCRRVSLASISIMQMY
jgi:hypothetical protein